MTNYCVKQIHFTAIIHVVCAVSDNLHGQSLQSVLSYSTPPHSMWGLLYCATCNEHAFGRHKILLGKQCNFLQQDGHFIDILSCSWKLTFCKLIN